MLVWCSLRHRFGLALKPLHRLVVGDGAEAEDLERNAAAQRRLLGLVDHSHAAAAQLAQDAELAQACRRPGGRSRRSMDELDAGQARLELGGQRGMGGQQLAPIRRLPSLEIGHVGVQDAGQKGGGVGRRNGFRLAWARSGRISLVNLGFMGLGHLPHSPAGVIDG